jgi:hypothetical protein
MSAPRTAGRDQVYPERSRMGTRSNWVTRVANGATVHPYGLT